MSLYDRLPDKDFIRLVVVSAGNWSEPICCRLRAVSFRVNPRYEALSYAWGLSGATRPILIEGSTVNVRNNLERALRYIRQKDNDVTFWVDALCINQQDEEEKSLQVGMMRKIYARATNVVVFLGDDMHHFLSTFEKKARLPKQVEAQHPQESVQGINHVLGTPHRPARKMRPSARDVFSFLEEIGTNGLDRAYVETVGEENIPNIIEALRLMLLSPWWTRMWVFQEVIVSRRVTIHYGDSLATWDTWAEAAFRLSDSANRNWPVEKDDMKVLDRFSKLLLNIERRRRAWHATDVILDAQSGARELIKMLRETAHRQASDKRDKVYALLGLAVPSLRIEPNYNLDTRDVYCHVARVLLQAQRCFTGLTNDMDRKVQLGLPTWVPDWSAPVDFQSERRALGACLYNASKGCEFRCWSQPNTLEWLRANLDDTKTRLKGFPKRRAQFEEFCVEFTPPAPPSLRLLYKPREGKLWIEGIRRGKIVDVSEPYFGRARPIDFNLWDQRTSSRSHSSYVAMRRVAKLRAFVFDLKYVSGQFMRLEDGDEDTLQEWFSRQLQSSSPDDGPDHLGITTVLDVMSYRQRLFITDWGVSGWGPADLKIGDRIFVLPGGDMPFALRGTGNNRSFQLIGDCFLPGSMDGEVTARIAWSNGRTRCINEPYLYHLGECLREPARLLFDYTITDLGWSPCEDMPGLEPDRMEDEPTRSRLVKLYVAEVERLLGNEVYLEGLRSANSGPTSLHEEIIRGLTLYQKLIPLWKPTFGEVLCLV